MESEPTDMLESSPANSEIPGLATGLTGVVAPGVMAPGVMAPGVLVPPPPPPAPPPPVPPTAGVPAPLNVCPR